MIESVGVAKDEVAKWVGITSAVVAGCQCIMGVPWGTASDYVGRKPVILLGLTFTMIFSLMFGFSHTLTSLIVARAFQGLMNGNVGIIRTMVAEMVPEKELQPRAFSVMPLVWTIGSIFGPAFGGALANPAEKHPKIFGNSEFLKKYPFALPNIASAILFVIGITTGFLFMKVSLGEFNHGCNSRLTRPQETLETRKDKRDYGLILGQALTSGCTRSCHRRRSSHPVKRLDDDETTALLAGDEELDEEDFYQETRVQQPTSPRKKQGGKAKRPSWGQVLTPQSILVLIAYAMLAMHSMAFDSLFPVFLHYHPQDLEGNPDVELPFKFAGGFGVGMFGSASIISLPVADDFYRLPDNWYSVHSYWSYRHVCAVPHLSNHCKAIRRPELSESYLAYFPHSARRHAIPCAFDRSYPKFCGFPPYAVQAVLRHFQFPLLHHSPDQLR